MKYILLDENRVAEVIPAENPDLPGFPIEERYAPDFIAKLLPVEDGVEVEQNWVYNPTSKTFSPTTPQAPPGSYTIEDQEIENAYREGVDSYE